MQIGEVREHSDTLTAFLLKGLKPEIYGDKSKVELSGKLTMTDEEVAEASAETEESLLLSLAGGLKGSKFG